MRRVGILISDIVMDNVMFEIKSRKSSKKLEAWFVLFLCTFPPELINVFKYCHVKSCVPFLTISEKNFVHFNIKNHPDIFFLDFFLFNHWKFSVLICIWHRNMEDSLEAGMIIGRLKYMSQQKADKRRLSEKQNFLQKILQKVAQMERKSGFLPWLVRNSAV